MALIGSLVALTGCTTSSEAMPSPTPTPSTSPSITTPAVQEPVATPTVPKLDPGDMSTWIVGSAGIGPIERGGSWAAVAGQLDGMAAESMCPSALFLTADASPTVYVGLESDGDTIRQVWVAGDASEAKSPATAAGITLGATVVDVEAAYPGIVESVIPYPSDRTAYAVADTEGSWIVFSLRDDVVTQIGASEAVFPPKELCG